MGRIISLVVIIFYIVLINIKNIDSGFFVYLYFIIPFACIWFGDILGEYTGHWNVQITSETPGIIIKFVGWLFLVLPVIVYFLI